MSCEIARQMAESGDRALAEHRASCLSCAITARAPYYEAPAGLEEKIRGALRRETAPAYWRWSAIAASLLLLVSLAANLALFQSRVPPAQVAADAVLSAHLRSLAGTHLIDVPSSDQHTVKPWFNGKLDFAPPVKTLNGFPLIGGRIEYIDAHPAAALIYRRNKHIINVFIWPASGAGGDKPLGHNGYNLRNWSEAGMQFWAVSDLNGAELGQFASLFRQTQP